MLFEVVSSVDSSTSSTITVPDTVITYLTASSTINCDCNCLCYSLMLKLLF